MSVTNEIPFMSFYNIFVLRQGYLLHTSLMAVGVANLFTHLYTIFTPSALIHWSIKVCSNIFLFSRPRNHSIFQHVVIDYHQMPSIFSTHRVIKIYPKELDTLQKQSTPIVICETKIVLLYVYHKLSIRLVAKFGGSRTFTPPMNIIQDLNSKPRAPGPLMIQPKLKIAM